MASPKKLTDGNVIWRSKFFEDMVFTDFALEVLKKTCPKIKVFKVELERAEVWLLANPARVPKKNFSRFILNWMNKANNHDPNAWMKMKADPDKEYPQEHRAKPTAPDAFNLGDLLKHMKTEAEKGAVQ